jgi:hypothetical protein
VSGTKFETPARPINGLKKWRQGSRALELAGVELLAGPIRRVYGFGLQQARLDATLTVVLDPARNGTIVGR